MPPLLLGLAVVVIAALGRLVSAWMRSAGNVSELLLPPALDRLSRSALGSGLTSMPT